MIENVKLRIKAKLRIERFVRRMNKQLRAQGLDPKEIKTQKDQYKEKIRASLLKLDYQYEDMRVFIANLKSYKEAYELMRIVMDATNQKLEEFIDFKIISKVVLKNQKPEFYLQLAKDFKNFKLEEDGQGSFTKLRNLIKIPLESIAAIVDTMVYTKNAGCPLNQKDIVKYYDSYRPLSEDLESLKEAWIFAYEHDIDIKITDFIHAIKYERNPLIFVTNFNKIKQNDLPISFDRFKIFDIEQSKISELISLMIKAKLANIYLDFEIIYDDLKLRLDVWEIIRYLIKFYDSQIEEVDYIKLRNYTAFEGDLSTLHQAFLYNKKYSIIDSNRLYSNSLEILLVKNPNLNFNALFLVKALQLAGNFDVSQEEVINDYLAGNDVFNVLNYMTYAESYEISISYLTAKQIDSSCKSTIENPVNCLKNAIDMALNPIILKGESFYVTTKDNIEIKANMLIEAVLQLQNYFKGSNEDVLFQRASAIFTDEIQRKYNHDEIIINIEKISNNVLDRLKKETRSQDTDYFHSEDMISVEEKSHNEHKTDEEETSHHGSSDEHKSISESVSKSKSLKLPKQSENEKEKFINTSKYMPLKVLIPKIEFVKNTFKEFEKEKEKFLMEKHHHEAQIKKIEAEIEIKKAWAKSKDLKYLILKDDEEDDDMKH